MSLSLSSEAASSQSLSRVAVVTGAESGLGYESVKFLLKHNVTVYALCHNAHKGPTAVRSLNSLDYKGKAIFIHTDLGDLMSVQHSVERILAKEKLIHTVFTNLGCTRFAAFSDTNNLTQSTDGNVGLYYLLHLLKPALVNAALHSKAKSVRVILMSSTTFLAPKDTHVMRYSTSLDATDKDGFGQRQVSLIDETPSVAKSLKDSGVLVGGFHLGSLRTDMNGYLPLYQRVIFNKLLWPIYFGTIENVNNEVAEVIALSGTYFTDWTPDPCPSTPEPAYAPTEAKPIIYVSKGQPLPRHFCVNDVLLE